MKFIFIYITNPTRAEARRIAKHLLSKKLIACANIFGPTNSLYRWKGRLADEKEHILIAKTVSRNFGKVKHEVEKIHSYDTPCIVKIPVSSNTPFFKWLSNEVEN